MSKFITLSLEAKEEATKYKVTPVVHAEDYIYQDTRSRLDNPDDPDGSETRAVAQYLRNGDMCASLVDKLVIKYHPSAGSRRVSFLEFAAGYGGVSRHIRKMADRYELTACDIHSQAVEFLEQEIGVNALLSVSDPLLFKTSVRYDVVFALSFFSHMPARTFGLWIKALFGSLANDGILIFTTHGRSAHNDMGCPALQEDGYWFLPSSEQKDLPIDEYGLMISTPRYVINNISKVDNSALIVFEDEFWWGKQNLYIVRKVDTNFGADREIV
jgi:SAM-dependent methyltransferase